MIARIFALVEIEVTKLVRQSFFYATLAVAAAATLLSVYGTWKRFDPTFPGGYVFGQTCFLQATSRGAFVGAYLVLVWTALSVSHESGLGFFRLVLSKPVRRVELFIAKYLTSLLFGGLTLWCVLLLAYGLSAWLFGFGDIVDLTETPAILMVPKANLDLVMRDAILLSLPAFAALSAFGLFCSVLTDNAGFAVGTAMGAMMLLQLGSELAPGLDTWNFVSYLPPMTFGKIAGVSPLLYALDVSKGITGDWSSEASRNAILWPGAFVVAFLGLSAIIFARKDLTN